MSTTVRQMGVYGVGVRLYFEFVLRAGFGLAFLGALSLPSAPHGREERRTLRCRMDSACLFHSGVGQCFVCMRTEMCNSLSCAIAKRKNSKRIRSV